MTEQLELMLLVAFVVSITGLLITGVIQLAVRLASRPSERAAAGHDADNVHAHRTHTLREHLPRGATHDQETSTRADEPSSADRRKWKA